MGWGADYARNSCQPGFSHEALSCELSEPWQIHASEPVPSQWGENPPPSLQPSHLLTKDPIDYCDSHLLGARHCPLLDWK